MERTTVAVAIALVAAGVGFAFTNVGHVAASPSACDKNDFTIADSEPLDIEAETLNAGSSKVGVEDVESGMAENLNVELVDVGNNGKLYWVVRFENADGDCVKLDAMDCEGNITTEDDPRKCTLDAPEDRTYHVFFREENNQNAIEFKAWSS